MCVQEVIGKSVKQAVFLPLYTAPDGYDLTLCLDILYFLRHYYNQVIKLFFFLIF